LVFVQITRTIPLRRTILQFSQILLTLLLTFMAFSLASRFYDRRIVDLIRKENKTQGPPTEPDRVGPVFQDRGDMPRL
jgi:hypothetical protein